MGQKGSLSYVWAPVGSRPPMVRDNRHQTAYIFGAICPARGIGAAVVTPSVNTSCMNLHLAAISTMVAPGAVGAVICDGAGWHHTGGALKLPDNVVLIPLPPYAPELNSMENVWEYLRENKLSAGIWDTYDAILDARCDVWNWLVGDPDRIRTIGTRAWATVNVQGGWYYITRRDTTESLHTSNHDCSSAPRNQNLPADLYGRPFRFWNWNRPECGPALSECAGHRYLHRAPSGTAKYNED